jgi:spermidine synthase
MISTDPVWVGPSEQAGSANNATAPHTVRISCKLDLIAAARIMSVSRIRGKLVPLAAFIEDAIRFPHSPSAPASATASACVALALLVACAPAHAAPAPAAAACTADNLIAGKAPWQQRDVVGNTALVTDGQMVPDGAVWDGPAAVKLESPAGSLTYDLGKATAVGAFFLQADANDTYKVSGSADGQKFNLLVQAANVVDRGHGMRGRTMQIEPTTVRYLRIGEGDGDGAFSISEFTVHCKAPTPFPPTLPTLEAPMAVGPKPANERPTAEAAPASRSPFGPFELTLAAIIVGLAIVTAARNRTSARPAAAAAAGAAPDTTSERYFPIVLLLFLGSGCAALMYEIIWLQGLQLVLGSSAVSIAVLLGTFMAGMCIGSLGLARYVGRHRHPLRIYAVLEILIAVSGLLMLGLLPVVRGIYTAIAPHGVGGLMLRGLFAAVCLIPPTVMMGATLPAVARWVETTPRGVSWLGFFYGGNTIGAVFGCLVAGFYLLRVYDMTTATFVAVALNLAVAGAAVAVARLEPRAIPVPAAAGGDPAPAVVADPPRDARLIYLAIGLSGMSALGAEVVWTRLFSLLLSGTTYTFSIILAVFLIGIGLGSGAGAALARRTADPRRALGVAQLLLITAIAWTSWNITTALPWWPINPRLTGTPWIQFQIDLVRCLWAILPAACLWGASFPLALASVASKGQDGGVVVGRVYAANTVGAIAGAVLTSLAFVGWIGTQNTERILIALAAIGALAAFASRTTPGRGRARIGIREVVWGLAIVELAAVMGRSIAPVPPALIGHGRLTAVEGRNSETFLYVGEGMSGSPAVSRDANGILSYHNAGKVQASSQPQDMRLQRMLGHLTTLVPANPRSVLVVACGAAVTAGAASIDPRVERLTIAEIEPLVPSVVAKYFSEQNFDVVNNPKVTVAIDDGRHFLATSKEKYDAITSDPFDPWVKGAANLYTKEFWELAKQHLNPGGVVTVWVPLYDSTMAVAKSEIATFFEAFPNGIVWGNTVRGEGYDIVLSGQVEPARIDVDAMETLLARPDFAPVARSLRGIGFDGATALLQTYGGRAQDLRPWLAGAEINTDRNLRLQFLAGFGVDRDQRMEIYRGIISYRRFPDDIFVGSLPRLAPLRAILSARSQ